MDRLFALILSGLEKRGIRVKRRSTMVDSTLIESVDRPLSKERRVARVLGIYYGMLDKGVRGRSLSSKPKKRNAKLSRVRCRVEPPFAYIKAKLGHRVVMAKTLLRNSLRFDRNCLIYNLMRAHVLLR